MSLALACWHCGADISRLPQPLGRRATCSACHAELHVCRLCRHYDPGKAKHCREPMAEEVRDKTRANFCEWFQPRSQDFQAKGTGSEDPRRALIQLFGDAGEDPARGKADSARSDLDRLFGD